MMLMPCGPSAVPTGGAGVALPACSSSLSTARTFFLPIPIYMSVCGRSAHLLDLQTVELDRRLPAEHVDQHLQLALLGVDLIDLAQEVREGAVNHADALAQLELDPDLGLLLDLLQDRLELVFLQRDGLVPGPDEA